MVDSRFTKPVVVERGEEIRWTLGGSGGVIVPAGTPDITDPQPWGDGGGSGDPIRGSASHNSIKRH